MTKKENNVKTCNRRVRWNWGVTQRSVFSKLKQTVVTEPEGEISRRFVIVIHAYDMIVTKITISYQPLLMRRTSDSAV